MRILIAHNRYQFSGGEDAVARDEAELLSSRGQGVELLELDNDSIHDIRGKLIAAASIFYSASSRRLMKSAIHDFQPDIVHIHNWFPMLSPSIIIEADNFGIPIVQTLHNFRMICANALLFRDGRVCTDCVGKSFPVDGILHGCYRGSRAGSAIVTAAYGFHRLAHTWNRIDQFIAVSRFEREMLIRGGLPGDKIAVKPNFAATDAWSGERPAEDFALYVGRLSPEKGIRTLFSAWNSGRIPLRLRMIGDGPMIGEVISCASTNHLVESLGAQPREAVYREMAKAKFLVFPSECYETFGRSVAEAFSLGTPALAADLGSVRELVEDGMTGYRFAPGNADALIAGALRFAGGDEHERMRANCRNVFLSNYTAEINYKMLMDIYSSAIENRKRRK
ncbi:MAG: glycosyltransferase family 4 protein [Terracidiphilus sp.]|jgi:glycosyltransferase involved in cell wall biosynthesis